ncbi:hypothetical protein DFJ74DRAFT_104594 [Hyaloraphidium curvatum]|nr:hypothetical protein DFJ74DRAFT_104594 [Hyaloraphidium curvatum]
MDAPALSFGAFTVAKLKARKPKPKPLVGPGVEDGSSAAGDVKDEPNDAVAEVTPKPPRQRRARKKAAADEAAEEIPEEGPPARAARTRKRKRVDTPDQDPGGDAPAEAREASGPAPDDDAEQTKPAKRSRGRKRAKSDGDADAGDPLKGALVIKPRKALNPRPPSPPPPALPPLPDGLHPSLARLDRIFRTLNALHSFASSRRDRSTGAGGVRFEILRSSAGKLHGEAPTLRDLALVSLVAGPDLLSFASMPESALEDASLSRGGGDDGRPALREEDDEEVVVVFVEGSNTKRRSAVKKYNEKKKAARKKKAAASAAKAGDGNANAGDPQEDSGPAESTPEESDEDRAESEAEGDSEENGEAPDEGFKTPAVPDSAPPASEWTSGFGGRVSPARSRGTAVLVAERAARLRKEVARRDALFRTLLVKLSEKLAAERTDPDAYLEELFAEENRKRRAGGASLTSPPRKRKAAVEVPGEPPKERPEELLALVPDLQAQSWWKDQIVPGGLMTSESRQPRFEDVEFPLPEALLTAFRQSQGIARFYSHQARGIDALLRDRRNVVIATSTASGKSVVYQAPILVGLEQDPGFRALLVFPTKALAQDQLRSMRQLIFAHPVLRDEMERNPWIVRTYDGDTKEEDRKEIRRHSRIVLTNPDMIHVAMLSGPDCGAGQWDPFFASVGLVVLDELHVYSSVFGSHTCNVFRRLRRLLDRMGNTQALFVACSATIAEPDRHMQALLGLREAPLAVDEDGSPRGERHHVVWNPPFVDPLHPAKGRRSAVTETSSVLRFLVSRGVRTVVFCKYRKLLELLLRQVHQDLEYEGRAAWKSRVVGYRAGYVATDRRKIERQLFSGEILAVVATTALELGVDIGSLDCVIHMSFPFNLASYIQQAGRAGRRRQDAMSILICDTIDPMSQYYANNPAELVSGMPTPLPIDPLNANVLEGHLNCAAFEDSVDPELDYAFFSPEAYEDDVEENDDEFLVGAGEDPARLPILDVKAGDSRRTFPAILPDGVAQAPQEWRVKWLRRRLDKWLDRGPDGLYRPHSRYLPRPPMVVPLRDAEEDSYSVVDETTGRVMEEIQHSRAIFDLYEGSVFIHQGRTYLVHSLNVDKQVAWLRPTNVTYLTEQRDYTDVDAIRTRMRTRILTDVPEDIWGFYGDVRITSQVFGYYKVDPSTRKILETVDAVDLPPFKRETVGLWVDVPSTVQMVLRSMQIPIDFAVHAAAHAMMLVLPRRVNFGSGTDVRTECKFPFQTRFRPARVTLYDHHSNGAGVTLRAFRSLADLVRLAWEIVETCSCEDEDGCVHCVKLASCKEHNLALNKEGGRQILRGLLGIVE